MMEQMKENHISVRGFVPSLNDPSGLRFPHIERAAARVFPPESGSSVTITNTMRGCAAELYVVDRDGSRHATLFDYSGIATATDKEQWWEDAIRTAQERDQIAMLAA
jgi:hypothetical protein